MVDMLELCGGSGGISQLAFSRGLSSGGNLDTRSLVALGSKDVQDAVMHYLDVNCDTPHEHHKEDLPHIKFCGKVVIRERSST
eukprot:6746206-Pyramimonas_sp.AAC.1